MQQDSLAVSTKGVVTNVTFYDSLGFIRNPGTEALVEFPFTFISENGKLKEQLTVSLREGSPRPPERYQPDWIVPIIFLSAFLLALVRTLPGNLIRSMFRFLVFRGVNEDSSRDTSLLFQWQSALFNLSSFLSISLFSFLAFTHYNNAPEGTGNFTFWIINLLVVVSGISLRHVICNLAGSLSGETEIFREYIISVYHAYRSAGVFFILLVFLILYTRIQDSPELFFYAGFASAALLYMLRIVRLLFIFISRRVSILYWILYLCALEILPVVIIIKYVTGLV